MNRRYSVGNTKGQGSGIILKKYWYKSVGTNTVSMRTERKRCQKGAKGSGYPNPTETSHHWAPKTTFRRAADYIYHPYLLALSGNSKLLNFSIKHTKEYVRALCKLKILSHHPCPSVFLLIFPCFIHLYFQIPLSRQPLWEAQTYWVLRPGYNVRHIR